MCFGGGGGGGGGDGGAGEARRQEEERQARIKAAETAVNAAFDRYSGVDTSAIEGGGAAIPDYYGGISKAYTDYYMPQVDEQATEARRQLLFQNPISSSAAYVRNAGDLENKILQQQANIRTQAIEAAASKKAELEKSRANLITQAQSFGGLENAGSLAAMNADLASRPAQFSPLANIFATGINDLGMGMYAERQGYKPIFRRDANTGGTGRAVTNVQ